MFLQIPHVFDIAISLECCSQQVGWIWLKRGSQDYLVGGLEHVFPYWE